MELFKQIINDKKLPKPFYYNERTIIYNADCRDILPHLKNVDLLLTSPPYNVGMEYEEIMEWPDFYRFTRHWLAAAYDCLKDGGVAAINFPKEVRHKKWQMEKYGRRVEKVGERVDLMCEDIGFLPREAIIWAKGNEGEPIASTYKMGADNNLYIRSVSEMILLHSKGRYHIDGGTGQRGSIVVPYLDETKDVWWIVPAKPGEHPCPFPAEIPNRLIKMFTIPRKHEPVVLDPFMGSGETLLNAQLLGRLSIGIDSRKDYCYVAARKVSSMQIPFDLTTI